MGFSGGGCERADAGHVEADREDEGEAFCFGEVCGQDFGDSGSGGTGDFCAEGGADEASAGSVQGVQDAEQGFFGDCRGTECQECLPFQTEEHGDRFDENAETVQDTGFRAAAEAVGQHEEYDGNQGNDTQGAQKDVKGTFKGNVQDIAEVRFVVGRQFHDQADAFFFGSKGAAEDLVYDPHHQEHEQKDGCDDQKSAGAAEKRDCDGRYDR